MSHSNPIVIYDIQVLNIMRLNTMINMCCPIGNVYWTCCLNHCLKKQMLFWLRQWLKYAIGIHICQNGYDIKDFWVLGHEKHDFDRLVQSGLDVFVNFWNLMNICVLFTWPILYWVRCNMMCIICRGWENIQATYHDHCKSCTCILSTVKQRPRMQGNVGGMYDAGINWRCVINGENPFYRR